MLDACILNLFRVSSSTLYRVGGGRTARKFRKWCTVLRGNRQMTEKYEYRSTVPRTFVQDCSLIWWIFHYFSIWVPHRASNALDLTSVEQSANTLLRRPPVLLALLQIILSQCWFQFRLWGIVISYMFGRGWFSNNNIIHEIILRKGKNLIPKW